MLKRVHLKVALEQLPAELPFFQQQRIHPEVVLQPADLAHLDRQQLTALGSKLANLGLTPTLHAPFHDLNPGALEPLVVEATRLRFSQTFDCAEVLGADLIVFHPGYEFWKYGGQDSLWLESSIRFWPPFIRRAEAFGCRLALENVFDTRPEPLAALLDQLESPLVGHCFDIGHWHLFSTTPLIDWLSRFARHLFHLHLHDNTGDSDAHLLPGDGSIDFHQLDLCLARLALSPSATLEIPKRSDWSSAADWARVFASSNARPSPGHDT